MSEPPIRALCKLCTLNIGFEERQPGQEHDAPGAARVGVASTGGHTPGLWEPRVHWWVILKKFIMIPFPGSGLCTH